MADIIATSDVVNYSGMLFNKGNTKTPFSTLIAGNAKQTDHTEFVTGQEYETAGGEQPNISEEASLNAPEASVIERDQKTNVVQIFQETFGVSYNKESNMGTLSGLNIAGQQANPVQEIDFQAAAKMIKIQRDIEFTFMQGVYNKATNKSQVNKTRGIMTAIESNVIDLGGEALRIWDIAEIMNLINEGNGDISNLVLWVDAVARFQLNADAEQNDLTIVPNSRNINGLNLSTILTPLGEINIYTGQFIPKGTVGIFNPGVIGRIEQPVPGKGNFFREQLAKVGAGDKFQIYGQVGLDHGPEWYHGKITNINPTFTKPKVGKKVFIVNEAVPTTPVDPVLETVVLNDTPTVGVATSALTLNYTGEAETTPTLAYQWKIATAANGTFSDIPGATSATYTPAAGDADKYIKVVVTATGSASGSATSNAKKVVAAG